MANKRGIYLDEAATTKVYPAVVKEMQKFYLNEYGNPSSLHEIGEKAGKAMNEARAKLAKEINARPGEIYFTSSGTEADNLAIQGLARANPEKKKIIISAIEHAALNETCNYLASQGYEIVRIGVDNSGMLKIEELEKAIDKKTLLVSVMHVNNILGTIQDISAIGKICKDKKVSFHTDAVQSFGKIGIDVKKMNVDMLSASAHKIGGPKGIGLLYIGEGLNVTPLMFGGGQEKGVRPGTENVPAIVGFAKAVEIHRKINKKKIEKIRDLLSAELEKIGGIVNGSENRIFNSVHVSFSRANNEMLVAYLSKKGIYVSAGSACDSKKEKEDHVLKAIGLSEHEANGSIRITIGEDFPEKNIKKVVGAIKESLERMKI